MAAPAGGEVVQSAWERSSAYEQWIDGEGLLIHRGNYVEDLRQIEVGWWQRRGCNAAFLQLAGQGTVNEIRVTEIAVGSTTRPARLAVDEVVFVIEGRGTTQLSEGRQSPRTFEWGKHSLFLIPRHAAYRLGNSGDRPARLLHYNALPLALTVVPDPEFLVDNDFQVETLQVDADGADLYTEPRLAGSAGDSNRDTYTWRGNLFQDLGAWNKLRSYGFRGAGRQVVWFSYPHTALWNHMSVLASGTYEKAHHRGLGPLMVILAGEGYSYFWEDGKDKVQVTWHEGSATAPPSGWFHQHFNVGPEPVRYIGFHTPLDDNEHVQIEYAGEEPVIRETFEAELSKRGLSSQMPLEVYEGRGQ
ncbi:MAG TPA: cupin domain-containing protein [Chloroflexota bacterium]